jgi:S1/P1 Nuclease
VKVSWGRKLTTLPKGQPTSHFVNKALPDASITSPITRGIKQERIGRSKFSISSIFIAVWDSVASDTSPVPRKSSANQWQARLQVVPVADNDLVLFMQATRWADDIRTNDKQQHRASWHYINWLFKPDGQPATVQTKEPEAVNVLTAMTENQRIVVNENDPERRAIALAWLFHLVGDIHQPLHTDQLFTVDYPKGDRGGNEICVRVTQAGQPMDLHRFWDGVTTSSQNLTRLRNDATALRNRQEF